MKEGKMRKFAYTQRTIKQAHVSNTETTLILCGYSRELANYIEMKRFGSTWIFLLLILLSVVPSPLLLARSPEYPQRIRVASVFEPFV